MFHRKVFSTALISAAIAMLALPLAVEPLDGRSPNDPLAASAAGKNISSAASMLMLTGDTAPRTRDVAAGDLTGFDRVDECAGGELGSREESGCGYEEWFSFMDALENHMNEACGAGNWDVGEVYCMELQEGGSHFMARAWCLE